jgi:hypothetical protein
VSPPVPVIIPARGGGGADDDWRSRNTVRCETALGAGSVPVLSPTR